MDESNLDYDEGLCVTQFMFIFGAGRGYAPHPYNAYFIFS